MAAGIADGDMIDPHAMDPESVLRFVKAVGGWPGKVIVIACEPDEVEEVGIGLTRPDRGVGRPRGRARRWRRSRACAATPRSRSGRRPVHELSVASAVVDTATRHADGRRVTAVQLRVGHLRQVVPDSLAFYFDHVAAGTLCEGARLEQEVVPGAARVRGLRARVGAGRGDVPLPRAATPRGCGSSRATSSRSSRSRSRRRRTHASHEGEGARGRARRKRDDRARKQGRLRPRGGARRQPDERAGRGQDHAARAHAGRPGRGARRGARGRRRRHARRRPHREHPRARDPDQHRGRLRRRVPSRREHGALGDRPRCRLPRSTCW